MKLRNLTCYTFLQISDDEDDTHPNIDTGSLFKWRHEARVQRMEENKKEHTEVEKNLTEYV
jgi:cell division cycle protein 37